MFGSEKLAGLFNGSKEDDRHPVAMTGVLTGAEIRKLADSVCAVYGGNIEDFHPTGKRGALLLELDKQTLHGSRRLRLSLDLYQNGTVVGVEEEHKVGEEWVLDKASTVANTIYAVFAVNGSPIRFIE